VKINPVIANVYFWHGTRVNVPNDGHLPAFITKWPTLECIQCYKGGRL